VPHDEYLVRFAVSPDERFLAMAARDRLVVRSLATGGEASSVAPDLAGINGIGVSPGGTLLAIATTDAPDVEIWNLQRSERMTSLRSHASVPVCVAFSPDGRRLCSSTIGHESIRLWDTTSWEETANLNIDGGAVVPAVRFLPDGNTLVAIDRSQRIHMWRAPSWEEIDAAEAPGEPHP
jgi:WD40 repeat protein